MLCKDLSKVDLSGQKRAQVDQETHVCRTFASWQVKANSKSTILGYKLVYLFTIYSLNKSIGLYMSTPSSGTVQVLGILVDPVQLFLEGISPGQTIHKAV
jgi:hypothetical protein